MKIRTTAALILAAGLAVAGCSANSTSNEPESTSPAATATENATELGGDFNDADAMFATMMIPHHEQAIDMSDMVLAKNDVDEDVRKLAEEIKQAQGPEIDQLQEWLDDWGVASDNNSSGHEGHGDGMMSDDDMSALESASGPEASRLFLEQMIVHHEGAVDMARTEVAEGQNADAVILAQQIINAQTSEIQQMHDMLEGLE